MLALPACKKKDPEASLPAATQVGANTGGCLINGQPFVAAKYGGGILSNPIPALASGFYEDSLYYLVMAGNTNRGRTKVSLFFRSQKPGIYNFDRDTPTLDVAGLRYTLNYATCNFSETNEEYTTTSQYIGQAVLTLVEVNTGISAGTFEFTAVSTLDPTKTVTITNGRFDRQQ